MGWASGVEIFDVVANNVLKLKITTKDKEKVLSNLRDELEAHDWDTQQDTVFADNPIVKKVLNLESE